MMEMREDFNSAKERLNFHFPYTYDEWEESNFVMENYHKHTTWSDIVQIDSSTSINEFISLSDKLGCKCYFSGEHGYPGEWLKCFDICSQTKDEGYRKKNGLSNPIKFRYSAEVYWVKDIHETITEEYEDKKTKTKKIRERRDNTNCHMVIVARTYNAMRKLNYIISLAHQDGFYYKPRIDLSMLFTLNKDEVYITSACIAGWKYEDAEEIWLKIWEHFGDSFFLEYQAHNTPEQAELNKRIFRMSRQYGIQTIIGLDTHYISKEDCVKRDNLLKRKGLHYDDENGWYMDFPDGKEVFRRMLEQKSDIPADEILYAMMNTHVFIDGCEELEYDRGFKIPVLPKYQELPYDRRSGILLDLLEKKYLGEDDEHRTQNRHDGMLYEYGEIDGSGTADYFVTNYEIIRTGIEEYGGKLTTTSRGSASSYYSSKLLGFTTMDRFEAEVPIYPERFITKDRILASHQMPDIDMNVSNQEPFVKAARKLLGEHGCYPLLAVGKLGEKSGFKLYADIKGIEPSVANEITSAIDEYNNAINNAESDDEKDMIRIEDYITNREHLKIFYDSKSYQGIIEQAKVHACGFFIFNGNERQKDVVGYGDIRYEIGLIRCVSESTGKSTVVANIEGSLLDAYGYVKDDFLIVDVVSIIDKLYRAIGRPVPTTSELRKMVENDEKVWGLYAMGATCCLNQCEKESTTKKVMKFKPKNIKELAAFIAAIRPGFKSLLPGFLNRIEYTNGEQAIDELLKDCFHYMLYQESVMNIFSWLGIPMKDSYDTIKRISKKKLKGEALENMEKNLRTHWLENIGNLNNFEPVYKVVKDSSKYSFNAPHALAMANDSLYEGWVKAYYTSVFYEVTMNHYQAKNDKNKVSELVNEAMRIFGYKMGSYEYGTPASRFSVDDEKKIIYPMLSSIKGVGDMAANTMEEFAQMGKDDFIDIYLSIKGTKVNSTVFENLVKIGYFHNFGTTKKLIETMKIVDDWKGADGWKKTIKKTKLKELGLDNVDIYQYATDRTAKGNVSETQFTLLDGEGLARFLASKIPNEEYGSLQLAKFQLDVLGYIDMCDPTIDWRFVFVKDLNTSYSPKFMAYSIGKGKETEFKIHKAKGRDKTVKTSFKELPIEDGDVILIKEFKKQPRLKKTDNGWEEIPGEFDWWIKDYSKVELA